MQKVGVSERFQGAEFECGFVSFCVSIMRRTVVSVCPVCSQGTQAFVHANRGKEVGPICSSGDQ